MLIAGGALRTMRLVSKATSNYHVIAQRSCKMRVNTKLHRQLGFFRTRVSKPTLLHAIDAASGNHF